MLNRKLSNYIYYGAIAFVIILIFIVRAIAVGSINGKIDDLEKQNIRLQAEITELNSIVQDNSDSQSAQIYELNKNIPNVYSENTLSYKVISKLERLGIDESVDTQRSVIINPVISIDAIESIKSFKNDYDFVEIQITFTTQDADDVYNFLDSMYNDDQLFILNRVSYNIPEDEEFVTVSISYIAFYDAEIADE